MFGSMYLVKRLIRDKSKTLQAFCRKLGFQVKNSQFGVRSNKTIVFKVA